tara:strand:+ start:823 stop:990 length:168 start_codon:yes stop_codon:yes gene_type:complete
MKLLYIYFKNKYGDKKNIIVIDSKKEYDKIQKTIDESISKTDNKNKLKQYIDTIT